ncbi:flagellin [Candidatus Manganitrophus noduliformans]|uniref:Flagellin n=1 Tax=Candidatus Manganitrophus noduliformans TaxID=2606439 RepID=A0A7X6ID13_9BACT|nr:flagellin [Candidatus Manganitrophus noduliformans]NKE73116.1 flagellin [Candidatus Manganitrophus noduliformans]
MALTVNTNMFSVIAQGNLAKTESPLMSSMQRLSSGLRINSSRDDAAGLAIATRMTRSINGLTVAARNANDGVSFAQTAEGSMGEMLNNLQRIYELANQAASYNTSVDRSSMNQEVTQLVSELNRVVSQTRFNGETFLNQAFSGAFQVGIEVNETISISTTNVSPDTLGVQSSRTDFTDIAANRTAIASAVAGSTLRANGISGSATLAGVDLGNAITQSDAKNNSLAIINRVNQYTGSTNVTAFSFGNAFVGTAATGNASAGDVNSGYITINGISIGSTSLGALSSGSVVAAALASAINAKTSSTGVYAIVLGSFDVGSANTASIALVNTTGAAITVAIATVNAGAGSAAVAYFGATGGSVSAGQNGQIIVSTPLGTTSASTNAASDTLGLGFGSAAASISISGSASVNSVTVNTVGSANLAILAAKQGLDSLNAERAKLGAVMNRLQSTIANIRNTNENTTAARSRIMDTDFAMETANLTKALITQQAGISILAQANTLPQQVLALLQG